MALIMALFVQKDRDDDSKSEAIFDLHVVPEFYG